MTRSALLPTFALLACIPLAGCASLASPTSAPGVSAPSASSSPSNAPQTDRARVAKSAGVGCAVGGALAFLTGKRDKAVAACAAGAVVGGVASYRRQLQDAEAVAAAARQAGVEAQVSTTTVQASDGATPALDALVLRYDPADMRAQDAKTRAFLDKLAGLLTKASNDLTVRFEGTDAATCRVPLTALTERGALATATVDDRCGRGAHAITVTPVPDVR